MATKQSEMGEETKGKAKKKDSTKLKWVAKLEEGIVWGGVGGREGEEIDDDEKG